MATHSSVLAWRIPGNGEPGGLLSMGSHRVGHDWSDLAAAAIPFSRKEIFPTQESNPGLPHCRQIPYYLSHQGSHNREPNQKEKYRSQATESAANCLCFCPSSESAGNGPHWKVLVPDGCLDSLWAGQEGWFLTMEGASCLGLIQKGSQARLGKHQGL